MSDSKESAVIKTTGMSCGSCEKLIEMTLRKEPGIEDVKADKDAQTTNVTFDPALISVDDIAAKINGLGYSAEK
jgi:copper chaperone CopZ